MVINPILAVAILVLAVGLIVLGILAKRGIIRRPNSKYIKNIKSLNRENIISALNESDFVKNVGSKLQNDREIDILFRKSKNPWNLTPSTYNFIRFGGAAVCAVIAIIMYFLLGWTWLAIFAIIGMLFFFIPKIAYTDKAKEREQQWNQLYQFMWVIKHNASFYDPRKVFNETALYIEKHAPQLTELSTGFRAFADHWNNDYMDDQIEQDYACFEIPKELYSIMLVSQKTGEFPENELDNLRNIIINKMDYAIKDTLSMTATQATIRSTPFLLISMGIIILFPTLMSLMVSFTG